MLPGVTLLGFICAGAPLCGAPFLGPYMKGISHDRHNLSCPKRGKKWEEEGKKRGKINLNQINTKRSILGCFWKFRYNHACKRYKDNKQKVYILMYKAKNIKFVGAKTKASDENHKIYLFKWSLQNHCGYPFSLCSSHGWRHRLWP